jgi:hypothetical protein
MKLDVRLHTKQVDRLLRKLAGPRGVKTATARALNKTATSVRAHAARLIREKRDMRVSDIKRGISIRRATVGHLVAIVTASGRPLSIRHFARAGVRGVTAKVSKNGKRVLLQRHGNRAFVNTKFSSTVFVRTTKKRLPIQAWPRVSGIAHVFAQRQIERAMHGEARSTFRKRIAEELRYVVSQAKR